MSLISHPGRRLFLGSLASLTAACTASAWAQGPRLAANASPLALAQIADMSAGQIDVTKDFLVGARAAWQDINAKGGLRGRPIQHMTLEVDGSAASLRQAVESLKNQPQVLALLGTVGDRAASQVTDLLPRHMPDIAHVAPWLQNAKASGSGNTFAIFASRQEQITHAVRSLSVMGVAELGAVYASPAEYATYRNDVEETAAALKLRLRSYGPVADLQQLGRTLSPDSPRILIFLGGTPELLQFPQGIDKQAAQRYIIAMSDVNLQALQQMGLSRHAPVIATQVVPLINSPAPVVKAYRDTLARLFDEPPTPQSLAGFIAARYSYEVLAALEYTPTRANVLQAFARRAVVDVGGLRIDPDLRRKSSAFVTQSMISSDGRLVG